MKLALSNIAWHDDEEDAVIDVCQSLGVEAIEVAPGRLSDRPMDLTAEAASTISAKWAELGLPISSMQALLFGQQNLALFGPDSGKGLVEYLIKMFDLAAQLGAGPLVFGSPKNRQKGERTFAAALTDAMPALNLLGEAASRRGLTFCLEPNAVAYGCDFMTSLSETAQVVRALGHPSVGLVVDTGNMQMVGDRPGDVAEFLDLVHHFHISRPHLEPVESEDTFALEVMKVLASGGYDRLVTIEMRRTEIEPVDPIANAVRTVRGWIDSL